MKVKTLIEILKGLNLDHNIYVSADGEGNSYSNPDGISDDDGYYILWPDDSYLDWEDLK